MPGYLPEMEPYTLDTADEAKRAMIHELLLDADHAGDAGDESRAFDLSATAEDLNLSNVSTGWNAIIGNVAYWITPTESEDA